MFYIGCITCFINVLKLIRLNYEEKEPALTFHSTVN